ncbi:hypothetical protein H7J93_10215 [Mycobacterium barrassiae]|nr:hypothetical protein [Mycobacterium barrassiae]MCV7300005.1 hypothetical protein [Mycobacterium barrassiae]
MTDQSAERASEMSDDDLRQRSDVDAGYITCRVGYGSAISPTGVQLV